MFNLKQSLLSALSSGCCFYDIILIFILNFLFKNLLSKQRSKHPQEAFGNICECLSSCCRSFFLFFIQCFTTYHAVGFRVDSVTVLGFLSVIEYANY